MPRTYMAPIANAPKKLGDKKVRVNIPINTGAQQALVIPEKIPRENTDKTSVFPLCPPGKRGIGNLIPRNAITEVMSITTAPIKYTISWLSKKNFDKAATPKTAGSNITKIPAPKTSVIDRTRSFSLNTFPK